MNQLFKIEKVADGITRITDISGVSMFLAEGEKKAVLIDTGVGIGDLKGLVDSLTDKPVKVLLTHGHLDHAYGAAPFEEIYMSFRDMDVLEVHADMKQRLDYSNQMLREQEFKVTEDMLAPKPDNAKIKDLKDGDVFDLGGLTVEVYELPGHTPGSMTMLFKEARLLLTGDACNPVTFLFFPGSPSVEEYRDNVIAYKERLKDRYDKILLSHGNELLDEELFDVIIETCNSVMDGTDAAVYNEFMGMASYIAAAVGMTEQGFGRLDGKKGNIAYDKENIRRKN